TAKAGGDYVAASGVLTFAPGESSKSITVLVNGDTVNEPDETFVVNLAGETNATVSKRQGIATITNDDAAPSLSIADVIVLEGNTGTKPAVFTVTLAGTSSLAVTV